MRKPSPTAAERREALRAAATPSDEEIAEAVAAAGDGRIYFVQVGDCGPIKIGFTSASRLAGRLAVFQTSSPFEVHLRRVLPGTRELERKLHRVFADARMRGEWFWATPELAEVAWGEPTPDFKKR